MKGFRPGDGEKSVTVSYAQVEGCLPESPYSVTLAPDSRSSTMYLNSPYLPPPWEGMVTTFSVEVCILVQNVAVPCHPAGEGSAGSYTCLSWSRVVTDLSCVLLWVL